MDIEIRIREAEEVGDQPFLLWDSQFDNNESEIGNVDHADWPLAGASATLNKKGLRATSALHTAILISLFTWKRAEKYDDLPSGSDPKGWWGDAVDVDAEAGETAMGSKLWLLLRSPLNDETARLAEDYALEALQPIVTQGAVAEFTVDATYDVVLGWLKLEVKAFSQSGTKVYDQKFSIIWSQLK